VVLWAFDKEQQLMIHTAPQPAADQREALVNDRAIGPAWHIAVPREMVTRIHGLVIDLDANVLKDNPWFPPGETAESFWAGITPVLTRHRILRHAEIRFTGRWLHAITWISPPVEVHTAAEQARWTGIHQVLKASVPSDPAAPALNGMTRPVGSTNSKTGNEVRTLKVGNPISAAILEEWVEEVKRRPFETLALVLFGERRITPCPFCMREGSHLDLGEEFGHCYGPCRRVSLKRLFEPFMAGVQSDGGTHPNSSECKGATQQG
jgi:hypothetical protein